jgi:hypothetical protein
MAFAEPWKFGVMADTQWKANLDGQNPGTVAVGIISQLNTEFINHGVEFVIQVGDLVDVETDGLNGDATRRNMPVRATAAQALYEALIGFYPLRGNHEGSGTAALEFQGLYPQAVDSGSHVFGATNFSSPFATLNGLSYSFDFNNARFVLLDQFKRTDNTDNTGGTNNNILDQQSWITNRLSTRSADTHAFVFSHKNLIGQNHVDDLLGSNPTGNPVGRSTFISSLESNGARYHFSGHDHMHHRSIVEAPNPNADGTYSNVQEIMCSSNSYKFYIPQGTAGQRERIVDPITKAVTLGGTLSSPDPLQTNDCIYNVLVAGGTIRETPIQQELFTVGYYIVTVDGPRVTVEHYSSPNGCGGDCDLTETPVLTFSKRETFGYSLNGQEFLIDQGQSYTSVQDAFNGTTAKILAGTNGSNATDSAGRALTKGVNTGWAPKIAGARRWDDDTFSDILTLWGMADLGSEQTDVYTLSMSYDKMLPIQLGKGLLGLATKDENGDWVNAVDLNFGGAKKFILGPWKPGYGLGTYGIDLKKKTAWAVINYNGDFAVAGFRHFGGNTWK